MEIAHPDPQLLVVGRQVFRHPLGQGGDEHPLLLRRTVADLRQQVVHLSANRTHLYGWIHQSGRADHLLDDDASRLGQLVGTRRRRDEHDLSHALFPLCEIEWAIVERGRQTESIRDQHFLARAVAVIHPANLWNRLVTFVDDDDGIFRQVVEQRGRRRSWRTTGEMPRIVLDAVAVPDLPDHLEVEHRSLMKPLCLEQLPFRFEQSAMFLELTFDRFRRELRPVA